MTGTPNQIIECLRDLNKASHQKAVRMILFEAVTASPSVHSFSGSKLSALSHSQQDTAGWQAPDICLLDLAPALRSSSSDVQPLGAGQGSVNNIIPSCSSLGVHHSDHVQVKAGDCHDSKREALAAQACWGSAGVCENAHSMGLTQSELWKTDVSLLSSTGACCQDGLEIEDDLLSQLLGASSCTSLEDEALGFGSL